MPTADPGERTGSSDPEQPSDAGVLEPVEGTGTGLQREIGRMPDGRRITYYWSRPGAPA